jgi:hypothetical protein
MNFLLPFNHRSGRGLDQRTQKRVRGTYPSTLEMTRFTKDKRRVSDQMDGSLQSIHLMMLR